MLRPLDLDAPAVETRASARRGTNSPGRHHFLMYKNDLSL